MSKGLTTKPLSLIVATDSLNNYHGINAGWTKMTVLIFKETAEKVHHHTKWWLLASCSAVTDLYIVQSTNACIKVSQKVILVIITNHLQIQAQVDDTGQSEGPGAVTVSLDPH